MFRPALVLSSAMILAAPLGAHELWIEPLEYVIERDTTIRADLVNGQGFGGVVDGEQMGASRIAFFPQRNAAFRYFLGSEDAPSAPVQGDLGQVPAVDVPPLADGLHVVAYVSTPATLNYETWEKFQTFVDHKDLDNDLPDLGDTALAAHQARALPEADFEEVYIRHSKTLVAVGDGDGVDVATGMETEIVALENPYTDDMTDGLRVGLLYQGQPRAAEQIELFERSADGTVTITLVTTDDNGVAILPVRPGYFYMADAVVLREPSTERAEATGAVWETLWANLTFAVPAE